MHAGTALLICLAATPSDDPASWLPADTSVYLRMQLPQNWEEENDRLLRRFLTEEGLREYEEALDQTLQEIAPQMPEQLARMISEGRIGIEQVHAAAVLRSDDRLVDLIAVVVCRSAEDLEALTEGWLHEEFEELEPLDGLAIWRLPRQAEVPFEVHIALAGRAGVVTSSREALVETLDRRARRRQDSITGNELFASLGSSPGVMELRHYIDLRASFDSLTARGRRSAYDFERADSVIGLRHLRAITGWMRVEEGTVRSRVEIAVDPDAPLLSLVRQPGGSQELWRWIPRGALGGAVLNTGDLEGFRARLRRLVDDVDRSEGERAGSSWEWFEEELQQALGVTTEEIVRAVGPEAGIFVLVEDFAAFTQYAEGLALLVRVREDGRDLIERISNANAFRDEEFGGWDAAEYHGETIRFTRGGPPTLAYALVGDVLIMASGRRAIEAAIDTHAGRRPALYTPQPPSTGDLPASKAIVISYQALWNLLEQLAEEGGDFEFPLRADQIREDAHEVLLIWETRDRLVMQSEGIAGLASVTFVGTAVALAGLVWLQEPPISDWRIQQYREAGIPEPDWQPPVRPTPPQPVSLPADPAERRRMIDDLVRRLGAPDPAERERATRQLAAIGVPAVEALAQALRTSNDPEVRARAESALVQMGAFDQLPPEVAEPMLERFFDRLRRVSEGEDGMEGWDLFDWYIPEWGGRIYDTEPRHNGWYLQEAFVLSYPEGVRRAARRLVEDPLTGNTRENLAAFLAVHDASAAEETLLQAHAAEQDRKTRMLLLIALGSCRGQEARQRILEALHSLDPHYQHAAILAAERSATPEMVDALLELVLSEDMETRFNAAYTLRRLTNGEVDLRPFAAKEEIRAAVQRAYEEWKPRRSSFRLTPSSPGALGGYGRAVSRMGRRGEQQVEILPADPDLPEED